MSIVDYTSDPCWENSLLAMAKNNQFIQIEKLDHQRRRAGNQQALYQMEHRELSINAESERDQAWACALSCELTLWSEKELSDIGIKLSRGVAHYNEEEVFSSLTIM